MKSEQWAPFSSDVFTESTHETPQSVVVEDPSEYNTRTESSTESQFETSDPARVGAFLGFYGQSYYSRFRCSTSY